MTDDWPCLSHMSTPEIKGQVAIMLNRTSKSQELQPFPNKQTKTVDIHFISFILFFIGSQDQYTFYPDYVQKELLLIRREKQKYSATWVT